MQQARMHNTHTAPAGKKYNIDRNSVRLVYFNWKKALTGCSAKPLQ